MEKYSRRQHHRSLRRKLSSNRVIHTSIRPWRTISGPLTNDTSKNRQNNSNTVSTNLNSFNPVWHLRDAIQNPADIKIQRINTRSHRSTANLSKNQKSSANVTVGRPSISSSGTIDQRNHRNKISPQQDLLSSAIISQQQTIIFDRDEASMDKMNIINDHHHKRKKKRKFSPLCIAIFVLIGVLLAIVFATVIAIIMIKSKTTQKNLLTDTNYTLRWNTIADTVAGVTGQNGSASNQLNTPFQTFIDSSYTLYITDSSNNRVQRWLRSASTGTTVCGQANGTWGTDASHLHTPAGILVDWNSNIYVADGGNSRILYWPSGASSGETIAGNGTAGNSSGQLNNAYGITLDSSSGTLYIADYGNHRVMSYASGATVGTLIAGNSTSGMAVTELSYPTDIYFDSPSNSLIIANFGAHNIVRWPIGGTNWTLVAGAMNGLIGNTSTLLNRAITMTLDPMGNVYVADTSNHRIQLFLVGESDGITIAGVTGISGSNSTLFNRPYSVVLDNQLNLYVTDALNHRIQRFLRY